MPVPSRSRGAKSRANLQKGGRHGIAPKVLADAKEVRGIARKLLLSPAYQLTLKTRLEDGSLHPSVQVMLWYYGFGKPKEEIEFKPPVTIKIVNEYSE